MGLSNALQAVTFTLAFFTHIVPAVFSQATATMGDGSVFVIGGSWSGGVGGKNGEVNRASQRVLRHTYNQA